MQNKTFLIGAYGIDTKDMLVLERIFKITHGRTRSYQVQDDESRANIDIAMVNVSNKEAIKQWGTENLDSNGQPSCPTLLVGKVKPKNDRFRFTPLPFFATRVLKSLDEITVEDLKYTPEIKIDDSAGKELQSQNSEEANATGIIQKQVISKAGNDAVNNNESKRAV